MHTYEINSPSPIDFRYIDCLGDELRVYVSAHAAPHFFVFLFFIGLDVNIAVGFFFVSFAVGKNVDLFFDFSVNEFCCY